MRFATQRSMDELIVDALANGQQISFRTISGSMRPTIPSGATFQVQRLPIDVGDVILANLHGKLTAHRLLRWDDESVYMRGDANKTGPGESVQRENIVGKVVYFSDIAKAHRLSNTIRPHAKTGMASDKSAHSTRTRRTGSG